MTRSGAVLAMVICAACTRAPTDPPAPPPSPAPAKAVEGGGPAPVVPDPDKELGQAVTRAWQLEIAGHREAASPVLAGIGSALAAYPRERPLAEELSGRLVADGTLVVVSSPAGVTIICDVATGKVVGTTVGASGILDYDLGAIPKTPLFVTRTAQTLVVREAPSGAALEQFDGESAHAAAADGSVLVVGAGAAIIVYDTHTRTITRRIALPPKTRATWLFVDPHGRAITAGVGQVVTYDVQTGAELVRHPDEEGQPSPVVSPDGQTIAAVGERQVYGHPVDVRLVDRATKKTLAISDACDSQSAPTSFAFSPDGKYLAVGRSRAACIFEVPGLRLVASTVDVRPRLRDDDAQAADVSFADNLLFVTTNDGTVGVFTVPGAKKLFIERGRLVHMNGAPRVVTEADGSVISVAASGAISRRPQTKAEHERADRGDPWALDDAEAGPTAAVFQRIAPNVCRIHDWLLPRAACD